MYQIVRSGDDTFHEFWLNLWNQDKIQHPYYQLFTREWFKEFEPKGTQLENLSFIVICDGKAVLGVLLMAYADNQETHRLSCSAKNIICLED